MSAVQRFCRAAMQVSISSLLTRELFSFKLITWTWKWIWLWISDNSLDPSSNLCKPDCTTGKMVLQHSIEFIKSVLWEWEQTTFMIGVPRGASAGAPHLKRTTCILSSRVPQFQASSWSQDCSRMRSSLLHKLPQWVRISPISSTWYKVTASVVVSQLKVLNCCCLLKVFGICVQTLIKATTFWTKRNPKKFFSDFPSELEEKARHVPEPWKNIGAPCFLALHCPHHLAQEQVCEMMECLKVSVREAFL